MALATLFQLGGDLVLPGWLLLIFVPAWRWTQRYTAFVVPILLATVYLYLLLHSAPPDGAGFRSLHAVSLLFAAPQALLAGWFHYLAFDLFTGSWAARDATRLEISRWLMAPILISIFLVGPLGLAVYLLVRLILRKQVDHPC